MRSIPCSKDTRSFEDRLHVGLVLLLQSEEAIQVRDVSIEQRFQRIESNLRDRRGRT